MAQIIVSPVVDDVLRLLLYVVVADEKIHQDEVDGFLEVADGLALADTERNALERGWLFDWFLQNVQEAKADVSNPEFSAKLVHLFIRLREWPEKKRLVDAACGIAAVDGHIDLNEKVLITMATAYWDAEEPEIPEIE